LNVFSLLFVAPLQRCVVGLLCGLLLLVVAMPSWAQRAALPTPPSVAAQAYMLLDATTDTVLAARNAAQPVEPASLTKLMSAYVVFDALRGGRIKLTDRFVISERAARMPGSRMLAPQGEFVSVEDLLKGMIVQSGNDATVALAEGVAGTIESFVNRMNRQAQALGLRQTRFVNPEGSSAPGHISTAADLAILSQRLLQDFPQYAGFYAIQRWRYPGTPAANEVNRNVLLFRDPTVDGLKTGYTQASGFCIVASARRFLPGLGEGQDGQRRLIVVVLGASSDNARAAEAQKLLNWGYTATSVVRLFAPGQPVATPPIWQGKSSRVALGLPQGILVNVPAGHSGPLRTELVRYEPILAPKQRGETLGSLRVFNVRNELMVEIPLQVLETVPEAGLWGRFWGALRLWLQ
jgi:serine-type D-Ala-D-Ala carboxypeptidase (penicillin-binding protein 5/6)